MASMDSSLDVSRVSKDESFNTSLSVAQVSTLRRSSSFKKSTAGTLSKSGDAAWFVFDNLSCEQAEDLLRQHGTHGTYLVAHFHDPESYGLSIRKDEDGENVVFKHYAIGKSKKMFHTEGIQGDYPSIEAVVGAVQARIGMKLVPIFHKFNENTSEFEVTMTEEDDAPPEYSQASRYPEAAKKPLPLIVPVYPTLRRMMKQQQQQQQNIEAGDSVLVESAISTGEDTQHGCCWKAFHTDVEGKWWKPQKAGPVTGVLLLIGWIVFLVLFGWIVGLALLIVLLVLACACFYNFICTGRCALDEEEEEGAGEGEGLQQERGRDGRQSPYSAIPNSVDNRTSYFNANRQNN